MHAYLAEHAIACNKDIKQEGSFMWVITLFLKESVKMYEFSTEEEARDAYKQLNGCKFLSEIVYFNDPCFL